MGDVSVSVEPAQIPHPAQPLQHQEPQAVAGVPRLFIGQVPAEKTEQELFPVFSPFGVIEKLSIVRGPDNKSRGCAMVEYKKWSEAEAALSVNGTNPFDGSNARPLVVHFANPRRNMSGQQPELAIAPRKLFVGQIPKTSTADTLVEVFGKFGEVEHVNILKSRGLHAGCAFVQFSTWASCEEAIDALHEKVVMPGCEHPLVVKFADAKRPESSAPHRPSHEAMAMMMGTHPALMQHGGYDVASMNLMGHPHHPMALASLPMSAMGPGMMQHGMPMPSPMSLGFGRRGGLSSGDGGSSDSLVDRGSSADGGDGPSLAPLPNGVPSVLALMPHEHHLHQHHGASTSSHHSLGSNGSMGNLQGMAGMAPMTPYAAYQGIEHHHHMQPSHALLRGVGKMGRGVHDPSAYTHKLFIGQVPFEASEQDIWPLFSPFGEILELAVLRSQGRSKGCAFLTYASPDQAASALSALNGRQIGSNKKLVVKYADSKKV